MISWVIFGSAVLAVVTLLHDGESDDFRGREIREARAYRESGARLRVRCALPGR